MLFLILLLFIVLSAGLAWFLIAHDRGEKEPIGALWMAAGFGVIGAVMASFMENHVVSASHLEPGNSLGVIFGAAMAVGVIEEACKFIPLAFFLYKQRFFNEHTDGVIYFALAGLGFGLPENILYSLQFGAKTGLVRVFLTPMFHAATTGIVGYFLAKQKVSKRTAWAVIVPLAAAMLLHGLYDFGLSSSITLYGIAALLITLGLSGGLFVCFLRATERDQDLGLSAVGHNGFCRSCGLVNPKRQLYCTRCGQHA